MVRARLVISARYKPCQLVDIPTTIMSMEKAKKIASHASLQEIDSDLMPRFWVSRCFLQIMNSQNASTPVYVCSNRRDDRRIRGIVLTFQHPIIIRATLRSIGLARRHHRRTISCLSYIRDRQSGYITYMVY